jgi:hypothetical protein
MSSLAIGLKTNSANTACRTRKASFANFAGVPTLVQKAWLGLSRIRLFLNR